MIGAFLNLSRPLAMQALSNPRILGSLLVGAVGSQQANEITNQLKLGNISLDNVYDTIINFAASPAVSALKDTPSGQVLAPDEAEIEAERKFNEELNRRVTLPSEISIDQILSTPQTTTVPEPLITPDVPEEKTKVEDVGFTEAKQDPSEFILTADEILSGQEFVSNATKLKNTKVKIPDVLEYLDSGKKRDIFNETDYKAMLDEGLKEINYQLEQEVTGEGWYDEGVRKAMEIAPKINPKFADNPDLKDLLLFTTAIASSGVNVGSDFKVGLQVADIFADTGKIPLTNPYTGDGWTVRGSNLAKQLALANNYIQENGLPAFLEFLHSEMTGREIQNFRKEYGNLGPSKGVRMEEEYSGHRAFGPKIGEFMANLYGTDDNNVTDMWNIRGMNRLMGGSMFMRDADGNIMKGKDGKIMENTGSPTKEFKNIFDKYMTDLSNLIGKSVRDTQAIRWYLEQGLYTALGARSVPKDYGTAAQEVLDQKLKTESDGTIRSSKTSNIKSTSPTKKAKGGYVMPLPEIDML